MSRVSLNTLLDRSGRNMDSGTHPVVRKSALKMIELAYAEGINVQISEGNRSGARQNELYAQGRSKPGNIVTNARAGQSLHNYGVAVDFFLTSHNGNTATWTVNKDWRRAAAIGKSLGFEWGGNWTSFKDYPHLQMMGGLTLTDLKAGKRPNLSMKDGSSVPKASSPSTPKKKSPTKWRKRNFKWTGQSLKRGDKGKAVKQMQKKLSAHYFYPNKGAKNNGVDSYMGANTVDAVKRFQTVNGLAVDGIAGTDVFAKLGGKSKSKRKKASRSSKLPAGVLKKGNRGSKVRKVQKALASVYYYPNKSAKNNGVDGKYGKNTANAMRRFQSTHGLVEDGIYGPSSKRELLKAMK